MAQESLGITRSSTLFSQSGLFNKSQMSGDLLNQSLFTNHDVLQTIHGHA
jgi:hypothetical protein